MDCTNTAPFDVPKAGSVMPRRSTGCLQAGVQRRAYEDIKFLSDLQYADKSFRPSCEHGNAFAK
jgi:hypothetical protein